MLIFGEADLPRVGYAEYRAVLVGREEKEKEKESKKERKEREREKREEGE